MRNLFCGNLRYADDGRDDGTATREEGQSGKSASSLRVPLSVVGERDIARGVTTGQERTEMSTVGVGPCDGAHSAHVLPQNTCIKRGKLAPVPFLGCVTTKMVKMSTIEQ